MKVGLLRMGSYFLVLPDSVADCRTFPGFAGFYPATLPYNPGNGDRRQSQIALLFRELPDSSRSSRHLADDELA